MACGNITLSSTIDCLNPLKGGTTSMLRLFNYEDVLSATVPDTSTGIITDLVLVSGATGYLFEGYKQDVKPVQEVIAPSAGQNQFKHAVDFMIYDISQVQKNNIQKISKGKFIAITENKTKDANAFEVYGLDSGMAIVPGLIRDSFANGGGYILKLATLEGDFESALPKTFYLTDYTTSQSKVNGFLALPSITNISPLSVAAAGGTAVTVTGTYFYGGGASSAVTSVKWVNQSTFAETVQTYTVASNTSITLTSVALTAGLYKLKVVTTKGTALSVVNVTSA